MKIKRITKIFPTILVFTGIFLLLTCEKFNGPEPAVCESNISQIVIGGNAIPLESIVKILVNDEVLGAERVDNEPVWAGLSSIGKITFQ